MIESALGSRIPRIIAVAALVAAPGLFLDPALSRLPPTLRPAESSVLPIADVHRHQH